MGGVSRLALGLIVVLGIAACGERERTPALAPVRVVLTSPTDLARVESRTVQVRGTVAPAGARVLVDGVEATVHGGEFSASVELEGGTNVIDVQAAAPRHPSAMTALRVTRLVPVRVPDLEGLTPDDAVEQLDALGLVADVHDGGLLDDILPGTVGVCGTEPPAGEKVRVGSTVTVLAQKSC
ncbi:MAG: hypothetical protein QOI80_1273 [Solirubrobacteraceae bacterium]|nr:hypothetical protein [Solirubrobacteraceae bacterium]